MKTVFKPTFIALACFSSLALANTNLNVSMQSSKQTETSASASEAKSSTANASFSQRISTQVSASSPATKPDSAPDDNAEPTEATAVSAPVTMTKNADTSSTGSTEESGELPGVLTDEEGKNDMAALALPELSTATLTDPVANINAAGTVSNTLAMSSQAKSLAGGNAQLAQQTATAVTANMAQSVQQQVQGSTNQLVQQAANAEVLQNVNQAVNAEVTNTVRNSLRLTTGL